MQATPMTLVRTASKAGWRLASSSPTALTIACVGDDRMATIQLDGQPHGFTDGTHVAFFVSLDALADAIGVGA